MSQFKLLVSGIKEHYWELWECSTDWSGWRRYWLGKSLYLGFNLLPLIMLLVGIWIGGGF